MAGFGSQGTYCYIFQMNSVALNICPGRILVPAVKKIIQNELMVVISLLSKAGQRPFFTPQMQQVCPRWQPMHSQQQVRAPGMQGMPGARQVPHARGIRQAPPRGVPGQQQPGGAGGPSQRVGGMDQAQVRGPGAMQGQGQRPAFKFQQNVLNQPAQGHPGAVSMQPQEQVPQTIQIPVSVIASIL